MDATNRNLDFTIHEHLDRFFGTYRNGALQERAAKALDLLLAHRGKGSIGKEAGRMGGRNCLRRGELRCWRSGLAEPRT